LVVAALALTLVNSAKAADEAKKKKNDPAETFKKLNTDDDKKFLSKDEFKKFAPPKKLADTFKADEVFTKLDADKDGKLSEEEFKKVAEAIKKKKAK